MKKLFVGILLFVLSLYPSEAFGMGYWVTGWDAAGDLFNKDCYGFKGIYSSIYVYDADIAVSKVASVMAQGFTPHDEEWFPYYYRGPDFAESGWVKNSNGGPRFFVAWANYLGYNHQDYSVVPSIPGEYDFSAKYLGYDPSKTNCEYCWASYFDSIQALRVWNRNPYAAPVTNEEHDGSSPPEDGYVYFSNIQVLNSHDTWMTPYTLGQKEEKDLWYYFNPDTCFPYGTAWQASKFAIATGNIMHPDDLLNKNIYLMSNDGRFKFVYQGDGNLVLYRMRDGQALWNSHTQGHTTGVVQMQRNGDFVLRNSMREYLWTAQTTGHSNSTLVVQNDGNVVVYCPNHGAVWNTETNGMY